MYATPFKKNNCTRTQSTKPIFIILLIFKIFASQVNVFREGTVGDHQPVRDVSKFGTNFRGGFRIFFRRGALVSCSTSTAINHIVFFFGRIPVVLENRRSSQGGGGGTPCTLPLDPPLNFCMLLYTDAGSR